MKKIILSAVLLTGLLGYSQVLPANNNFSGGDGSGRLSDYSLRFDFGLNNYLENGRFPDAENRIYSVKPWGSWYVAFGPDNYTRIAKPLYINWGADIAWYNFKFENPAVTIVKEADNVVYYLLEDPELNPVKSKLTAVYLDAYFVPTLYFGRDSFIRNGDCFDFDKNNGLRIGMGGYAGYKIDSYSKYVAKEEDGDKVKDRDHSGFFLNNFRYGLRLQIGVNDLDFFANYDLSELFAEGRGPRLNAFSFGITL